MSRPTAGEALLHEWFLDDTNSSSTIRIAKPPETFVKKL